MQVADPSKLDPAPRQRVFIGDVHGCADELEDLIAALEVCAEQHEIWFVGDLVNGGPHSAAVVRRAMALGASAVLGNHDLHALSRAAGVRSPRPRDTLDELLAAEDSDVLLGWLSACPLLRTWPDVVLVHAGLSPAWSLQAMERSLGTLPRARLDPMADADVDFATSARLCDAEGRRPASDENAGSGYAPWHHWYGGDRTVVFGHWARQGLLVRDRLRGLDSGCVYGGRLTAWIAEQDVIVSVPAHRTYVTPGRPPP